MNEQPMTKLEALRFIARHFGIAGTNSNLFNDLLNDHADDHAEFTIGNIVTRIKTERDQQGNARP